MHVVRLGRCTFGTVCGYCPKESCRNSCSTFSKYDRTKGVCTNPDYFDPSCGVCSALSDQMMSELARHLAQACLTSVNRLQELLKFLFTSTSAAGLLMSSHILYLPLNRSVRDEDQGKCRPV